MSKNKNSNKKDQSKIKVCSLGPERCPIYDEVEQLKKEAEELRAQVTHDFLTELYNTRHMHHALGQEVERTLRSHQPTTLILLDIDFFKKVNDSYGHAAGDIVLKQVAKLLVDCVRKLDVCCRYGGEEFAIILPSTHLLVGTQVAERIRQRLENTVIHLTEGNIQITASFGVNTFHYNTMQTQNEFLDSVDKQLYRAKKAGRNKVCSAPQAVGGSPSVSADERAALFGTLNDDHSNS